LDGTSYVALVMEYATEGDLLSFVLSHSLTERQCRNIAHQIITAVDHLHRAGIAHLDLSLENILVFDNGSKIKISDFGSAKNLGSACEERARITNVFGKLLYVPPEFVLYGNCNGFLADVYGVGVILFCLLYGFMPYHRPSISDPAFLLLSNGEVEEMLNLYEINGVRSWYAQDLLVEMLAVEDERVLICQMLNHPWFDAELASSSQSK